MNELRELIGFLDVFGWSPQAIGHKKHKMTQERGHRSFKTRRLEKLREQQRKDLLIN